ncbi:MAG: acyltransferase family protein [Rhodospirillales bacterium]
MAAAGLIAAGYGAFLYTNSGEDLYAFSKTLASYEYRQHLGLSKRFLLQYGHMVFLFGLLLTMPWIFTGSLFSRSTSRRIAVAAGYTVPVFVFHFPLLYFVAAMIGHDPASDASQAILLVSATGLSILAGWLCLFQKPWFDGFKRRYLDRLNERLNPDERDGGPEERKDAMAIEPAMSDAVNIVKILAMAAIVLGHFSFDVFSSWRIPGFDGNAPRFAVPAFFMVSGYFAMLSVDRTVGDAGKVILKRYWSLVYLVVPMLLLTPILDMIGFMKAPELYDRVVYFDVEKGALPVLLSGADALWRLPLHWLTSLLYINESWIFTVVFSASPLDTVHAFSNEAYWFLCYLMPFTMILAIARLSRGWRKWTGLAATGLFFGPPILLLAPLFFAGALAYLIHKHR